jgi:hypothetical protein
MLPVMAAVIIALFIFSPSIYFMTLVWYQVVAPNFGSAIINSEITAYRTNKVRKTPEPVPFQAVSQK